jgi:hypothetical protein
MTSKLDRPTVDQESARGRSRVDRNPGSTRIVTRSSRILSYGRDYTALTESLYFRHRDPQSENNVDPGSARCRPRSARCRPRVNPRSIQGRPQVVLRSGGGFVLNVLATFECHQTRIDQQSHPGSVRGRSTIDQRSSVQYRPDVSAVSTRGPSRID